MLLFWRPSMSTSNPLKTVAMYFLIVWGVVITCCPCERRYHESNVLKTNLHCSKFNVITHILHWALWQQNAKQDKVFSPSADENIQVCHWPLHSLVICLSSWYLNFFLWNVPHLFILQKHMVLFRTHLMIHLIGYVVFRTWLKAKG